MIGRANGPLDAFRRSRFGALAAVVLLLFQVVLSTDHLGAVAARATGLVADDAALGLLSLCGGYEGNALSSTPTGAPMERDGCVLCSLATLAGHGVAASAPIVDAPFALPVATLLSVVPDVVLDRRPLLRHGTLRGPPSPVPA